MDKIYGFFADRTVKAKLFFAFGMMILLIAVLAVFSYSSLTAVVDRTTKADDVNRMVKSLQSARVAEKNFDLRSDSQYAETLSDFVEEIQQEAAGLESRFNKPDNKALMREIIAQTDRYEQSFNDFVSVDQDADAALVAMRESARQAEADLNALRSDVSEQMRIMMRSGADNQDIANAVEQRDLAGEMSRGIQDARVAEKNFIIFNDLKYASELDEKLSQIESLALELERRTRSPELRKQLESASKELKEYDAQKSRFLSYREQQGQARENMVAAARKAMDTAEAVRADQKAQSTALQSEAIRNIVVMSVGATLFALLAAWVINRLIVPPLLQAKQFATLVADGDLTAEAPKASKDEVGELMSALQRMVVGLRDIMNQLSASSQEVASSSEELSVVTNQTRSGVQTQDHEIEQMATALEEMSSTIQEVAQNAETAASEAGVAKEAASSGESLVVDSRTSIRELSEDVARAAGMIDEVREESNSVSGVIEVIEGIAEQTNLLALNAAIEAARAGEHGRGFAVVSDEVRNLSQRTQESTENITKLIKTLQEKASTAVQAMKENESKAEAAAMKGDQAAEALRQITEVIEKLSDMNTQTASAATEQSSVAEEISRSVQKVREISEQTMAGASETSDSSDELARLAQTLQNLIARFKL